MLKVKVHGQEIPVKLTPNGVFYIEARTEHAKTLKGLEKKLNAVKSLNPDAPPVRVEHKEKLKQGVVTGKKKDHYRRDYRVKWDDGTRSVISDYSLRRPMTAEQRHQLETYRQTAVTAEDHWIAAQTIADNYEAMFDIVGELRERYNDG